MLGFLYEDENGDLLDDEDNLWWVYGDGWVEEDADEEDDLYDQMSYLADHDD